MKRGDIVIVDFPFADMPGGKIRPAVVVQADIYNAKLAYVIVAVITGNLKHANDPANLLIDPRDPDGASSGLHGLSLIKCTNIYTASNLKIMRTIGFLSPQLLNRLDGCLKMALSLT